jgi:hypothetical protein
MYFPWVVDGFEAAGHSKRADKLLAGLCIGDLCAEGESDQTAGESGKPSVGGGEIQHEERDVVTKRTGSSHDSLSIEVEPERWVEDEDIGLPSSQRRQSGLLGRQT